MASSLKVCCVLGCSHTTVSHKHLKFFAVPVDSNRRTMWLRLISREDLTSEPNRRLHVCELHFEQRFILPGNKGKVLRRDAIPTLYCGYERDGVAVSLPRSNYDPVHSRTQTEIKCFSSTSAQTDTSMYLSGLPFRTAGHSEETEAPAWVDPLEPARALVNPSDDIHDEIKTFYKLCDKFLTTELADLVKLQTVLKLQNKLK